MTHAVRLRMFKLRLFDAHCHIVASHDDRGQPIDQPGVDLRGAEARGAFDAALPLLEEVRALGDGAELRALSLHLERRRLIATFHPRTGRTPTAIRIDDPDAFEAVGTAATAVTQYLADCAAPRLARRRLAAADPGTDGS